MFTKSTAVAALALSAGFAVAAPIESTQIDRSSYEVYSAHAETLRGAGPFTMYSDIEAGPDGYVSFPDTAIDANGELEVAGTADYTSVSAGDIALDQFVFVGGVDQAGGVMFIDFYNSAGDYIDGFGVQLAEEGNFIWTIDLSETVMVASSGFVQMSIDDEDLAGAGSTAAGRWFLGNNGATVGDAGLAEGDPDFNFAFELNSNVPAPGAMALLGFGGLCASRRRR
ncbi:MAG: hypothetical protein ACF8MF_05845 [Phycisphaerales bacterium JB052]